jgi:hypothetical protein
MFRIHTDKRNKKDLSREEDEISLRTKVGHIDLISIGKREMIIIDVLDDDEDLTSFH